MNRLKAAGILALLYIAGGGVRAHLKERRYARERLRRDEERREAAYLDWLEQQFASDERRA